MRVKMKAIFERSSFCWIRLLVGFAMGGVAFAQTGAISSQASDDSTTLAAFLQVQHQLAHGWRTLVSQGATEQQLDAWEQQNASLFQAQQQLAQTLSLSEYLQPEHVITEITIPANASSTLQDFLVTRATLANARAQMHNQLLEALPSGVTENQVSAMQQQEVQLFQQQHGSDLELQGQRAQTLAAESASQPIRVPRTPPIPPNATPQLTAFLIARNALATDRARLWNQYVTADQATREAALQQWEAQNAARIQQLQAMAQELTAQ